MDEFSTFSTFSVVLLVLGRPERPSSSSDTRPAYPAQIMFSKALMKHLPSSTQNLMQTGCWILPAIVNKMKHEVEKALV
jgi:hypothetical protein